MEPLHRYRLAGQLTEIRASDLAFTSAEAGQILARLEQGDRVRVGFPAERAFTAQPAPVRGNLSPRGEHRFTVMVHLVDGGAGVVPEPLTTVRR
jgi:hypothetical protein